jgi:hypothetical protein
MPIIEAGSASPRGAFSKLRKNKGTATASTTSLASASADGDDSSESGRLRASMDASMGKGKERSRRRSTDDRGGNDDNPSRRLSSLLPRRKRPPKDLLDVERTGSGDSGKKGNLSMPGSRSETSLLDDSGHSSILTDDNSDIEGCVQDLF